MRVMKWFPYLILIFTIAALTAEKKPLTPDKSAQILRKQLEAAQNRAKELENEKARLEQTLEKGKVNVKKYDESLKTYSLNIQEAEKMIRAAQSEMDRIYKRNDEREMLIYRCVYALDSLVPKRVLRNPAIRLQQSAVAEAGVVIAEKIFNEMQSEAPRLKELQNVVEERRAYQERITQKYLPADTQKKEKAEQLVNQKAEDVQKTHELSKETQRQVQELQTQLAAAEKKIEEIRRQAELKRQKEQSLAASRKSKSGRKTAPVKPVAPPPPGKGVFAALHGKLAWPAPGTVVRPYGEFTHPQFQVTMKNSGIDVRVAKGAAVAACAAGIVLYIGDIPGYGSTVILDHGDGYITVYGNVTASVSKQSQVKARQNLGVARGSDEAGNTTYHFEIRFGERSLNPLEWLGG